jgi:hypothetical protein
VTRGGERVLPALRGEGCDGQLAHAASSRGGR